jgi:hypothetical protein
MTNKTCQKGVLEWCVSLHLRLGWSGLLSGKFYRAMAPAMVGLLLVISWLSGVAGGRVQAQAADEYQIKAAFLYNQLVVGLIGDDPFGSTIDQTISGKSINGRQLTIQRLKWGQNLRECHILFIAASERKRLAQILESLRGANVLTVSELDKFCLQGGLINFILEENKVRFEINLDAAEQAGLKISSRLLTLAKSVKGGAQAGRN